MRSWMTIVLVLTVVSSACGKPTPALNTTPTPACPAGVVLRIDNRTSVEIDIVESVANSETVVATVSPGIQNVAVTPASGGHYLARGRAGKTFYGYEGALSGQVLITRTCATS